MVKLPLSESIHLDWFYRLLFFLLFPWLPTISWYKFNELCFLTFLPFLTCTPWFHLACMCPLILTDGLGLLKFIRTSEQHPNCFLLFLFFHLIALFAYIYCSGVCPLIGFLCILCPPSLVSIWLAYPLDPKVNQWCLVFNYHISSNLIHLSFPSVPPFTFCFFSCFTFTFSTFTLFWGLHLHLSCYITHFPFLALMDFIPVFCTFSVSPS